MMANIRILRVLLLFSFLSCSQPKKQYGPDDYLYLVHVSEGVHDKFGYKDRQGNMVIPFGKYYMCFTDTIKTIGFVAIPKQGYWAINKNDKKLFRVLPYDNGPDYIENGLFRILNEDDLIGFANMDGEIVIPPQYPYVAPFYDSIAPFCVGCKTWRENITNNETTRGDLLYAIRQYGDTVLLDRNTKYGVINIKGDTVLQPIYDRIDDFKDSIALVYKDGRAFYIDRQGNEVAYDPKKHPNQKPLDPHISKRIKYIDSWESLLKD